MKKSPAILRETFFMPEMAGQNSINKIFLSRLRYPLFL